MYAKNKSKPLTETQLELLDYIKQRIRDDGYPPTLSEICSWFGWSAKRSASEMLERLEAAGVVELHVGVARGIRVIP